MKLSEVLSVLRTLSPESLAESWDRVGLHLGSERQEVARAMLCIDLTEPVLDEAIRAEVDLIVAYHPPIFNPLTALTDRSPEQRIALRAARAGLAVYSPHTALDSAEGGLNDWLAEGLGEGDVEPIQPAGDPDAEGGDLKLVIFVPPEDADRLRSALSDHGAGVIGHYRECSFSTPGEGTFRGDETTHPAAGQAERFERVPELRLEMVLPRARLREVMETLHHHHPYEAPAYDLVPLISPGPPRAGAGRRVQLKRAIGTATLVDRLKKRLGVGRLEVARPAGGGRIKRIGLGVGAAGSLRDRAGPIDAFITGEMRHHPVLAAAAEGVTVLLAGHTQTERPYLPIYRQRIREAGADGIEWRISRKDKPPTALV